ncbi:UDP-glycosyltransferase 85A5 [Morella rubra]|uniref:UDP-glycosyltransferase 85A5 n=1 Tax=Morella rubra TaxID=262757 RepID=A0A6A1WBP0_9ROSI|nr:UDP-glycosyltransferase 85A5 [Morella rubra]
MPMEENRFCQSFPTQGHIKPLLSIAGLLCEASLHITFVNSDHNHQCLTNLQVLSTNFPTLQFESIPDGLPIDHPHDNIRFVPKLLYSIMKVMKQLFRELLVDYSKRFELPVTCIILDMFVSISVDFAKELEIHMFAFCSFSAAFLWFYCCLLKLIEEGQVPIQAKEDMDRIVIGVLGMEGLLRCRDLPSFCRQPCFNPAFKLFIDDTEGMLAVSRLIVNTFNDIEAQVLSHMAPLFSNVYTIRSLSLASTSVGEKNQKLSEIFPVAAVLLAPPFPRPSGLGFTKGRNKSEAGLFVHPWDAFKLALCDLGLNPEALAALVKELRREPQHSSSPPTYAAPSSLP